MVKKGVFLPFKNVFFILSFRWVGWPWVVIVVRRFQYYFYVFLPRQRRLEIVSILLCSLVVITVAWLPLCVMPRKVTVTCAYKACRSIHYALIVIAVGLGGRYFECTSSTGGRCSERKRHT